MLHCLSGLPSTVELEIIGSVVHFHIHLFPFIGLLPTKITFHVFQSSSFPGQSSTASGKCWNTLLGVISNDHEVTLFGFDESDGSLSKIDESRSHREETLLTAKRRKQLHFAEAAHHEPKGHAVPTLCAALCKILVAVKPSPRLNGAAKLPFRPTRMRTRRRICQTWVLAKGNSTHKTIGKVTTISHLTLMTML